MSVKKAKLKLQASNKLKKKVIESKGSLEVKKR